MPAPTLLDWISRDIGHIPLGWAGAGPASPYVNFGDALSPIMVALCTGLPVARLPFRSTAPRLAAVGTIGHGFAGGEVWFWGTCSSRYSNPFAPADAKVLYTPPSDTIVHLAATRGPISEAILSGNDPARMCGVYGDPVWLLPRFYNPPIRKTHKLGVILHLSDLTDRAFEVHFNPLHERYVVPEEFAGDVRLINTVSRPTVAGQFDKLDEILACERIVSTSLHGMVLAEAYGIPCLYFGVRGQPGLGTSAVDLATLIDLRILDLYGGLRMSHFPQYVQPRRKLTDWADVMTAIDKAWQPLVLDEARLLEALPVRAAPVAVPPGTAMHDLPVLAGMALAHGAEEIADSARLFTKARRSALREAVADR